MMGNGEKAICVKTKAHKNILLIKSDERYSWPHSPLQIAH